MGAFEASLRIRGLCALGLRMYTYEAEETTGVKRKRELGVAWKGLGSLPARGCANGKFLLCVRGPPGPGDSQPDTQASRHV